MTPLNGRRNQAGARYAAAVIELRTAFAELAALDQITGNGSFGIPPDIISLRHPEFAPNVSGAFSDDIRWATGRLQNELKTR